MLKLARLLRLVLLLAATSMQNACGGLNAVALGPDTQMVLDAGVRVAIAQQDALAEARRQFGSSVRIVARSRCDWRPGIAARATPMAFGGSLCVAVGASSATEADTLRYRTLAIGGMNPRVTLAFSG